jgi:hypothetical protein
MRAVPRSTHPATGAAPKNRIGCGVESVGDLRVTRQRRGVHCCRVSAGGGADRDDLRRGQATHPVTRTVWQCGAQRRVEVCPHNPTAIGDSLQPRVQRFPWDRRDSRRQDADTCHSAEMRRRRRSRREGDVIGAARSRAVDRRSIADNGTATHNVTYCHLLTTVYPQRRHFSGSHRPTHRKRESAPHHSFRSIPCWLVRRRAVDSKRRGGHISAQSPDPAPRRRRRCRTRPGSSMCESVQRSALDLR